jgi:site-specific recombinase
MIALHPTFLTEPKMGKYRRFREMIAFLHLGVNAELQWEKIQREMETNAFAKDKFLEMLHWFLDHTNFQWALAQNGILGYEGFWSELNKRLGSKVIAPVYSPNSLDDNLSKILVAKDKTVVQQIFKHGNLREMFQKLQFFETIPNSTRQKMRFEIRDALIILTTRLASEGLLPEVIEKLEIEQEFLSPMVQLQHQMQHFLTEEANTTENYVLVWQKIADVEFQLKLLQKHKDQFGISLRMAFTFKRMELEISRIRQLVLIYQEPRDPNALEAIYQLVEALFKNEFEKKHVRPILEDTLNVLAYKIVEQTSRKGENFIAIGRKAWLAMLRAAMGGGLIVSIMVITKTFLHFLQAPPLIEALLFSLNYGLGFTIVQSFGFTIATKQPSMTASTLAGSIRKNTTLDQIKVDFTRLVKRISSTQTVALLGNLLMVGPFAYLWAYVWEFQTGTSLLTHSEAEKTLQANHPWESGLFFYAILTGVFLMLSGLMAGFVENKMNYDRLPARIKNSLAFKQLFGVKRTIKLAKYIEHNLSSLAGNFSLGFFLGTASFFGLILGLPIDIRHVTFVFGNIGVAFQSLGNVLPNDWKIWHFIFGVLGVATINVVFSFGLSLLVAVRSRGIRFGETPGLFRHVIWTIIKEPWSFILPKK